MGPLWGDPGGGAPLPGTLKVIQKKAVETSISIGTSLGNLEGGSFNGDFERRKKESSGKWASLSLSLSFYGGSARGTRRECSFMGTLRIRNGRLWTCTSLSIWIPLGSHGGGVALLGSLRERWDFVLSGDLVYWGIRETCTRRRWKLAAFSTGARWRTCRVWGRFTLCDKWIYVCMHVCMHVCM